MTCPNCQTAVDPDATTCPNCGHDLKQVVVASESPAESEQSARPGWLIFGAAAALVLTVGFAAFALVGNNSGAGARLADRFPADTSIYLEFDIAALDSEEVQSVIDAFAPLAEEADMDSDAQILIDEFVSSLDEELAELDLNYAEDIQPWASGTIAAAVVGDLMLEDERAAVVVGGSDPAALDSLFDKLAEQATATHSSNDTDFLVLDESVFLGRVGTDLVAATDAELADLMSRTDDETLADDGDFAAQVNAIPASTLALVAVDSEAASAADLTGMSGMVPSWMPTGWIAMGFGLDDGNLRIDVAATSPSELPPMTGDDRILEALPAETIAFFRVGNVIQQARLALEAFPMNTEELFGMSLEEVFDLFAVDGAVSAWPSTDPEIPVNVMVAALGEDDPRPTVDALAGLIEDEAGISLSTTDWGYLLEGIVGLGVREELTLLTTDTDLIGEAPADGFESSELYSKASSLVPGDLQLAVDVPAVIDIIDGFLALSGETEAAEALACVPLGTAAAGSDISDTQVRSTFVLEIVARC